MKQQLRQLLLLINLVPLSLSQVILTLRGIREQCNLGMRINSIYLHSFLACTENVTFHPYMETQWKEFLIDFPEVARLKEKKYDVDKIDEILCADTLRAYEINSNIFHLRDTIGLQLREKEAIDKCRSNKVTKMIHSRVCSRKDESIIMSLRLMNECSSYLRVKRCEELKCHDQRACRAMSIDDACESFYHLNRYYKYLHCRTEYDSHFTRNVEIYKLCLRRKRLKTQVEGRALTEEVPTSESAKTINSSATQLIFFIPSASYFIFFPIIIWIIHIQMPGEID